MSESTTIRTHYSTLNLLKSIQRPEEDIEDVILRIVQFYITVPPEKEALKEILECQADLKLTFDSLRSEFNECISKALERKVKA